MREGWEILNVIPESWVDHIGKAEDLSYFEDNTFTEVYSSHVLEHLGYHSALPAALKEWHRVLVPEGRLMVSVPDLDTLCELYLHRGTLTYEDRFNIMRMMFGGQVDQYDFHYAGLNEELLTSFLSDAGFREIRRVDDFGLFIDCSSLIFAGRPISLNLIAHKGYINSTISTSQLKARNATHTGRPDSPHPDSPSTKVSDATALAGDRLQAPAGWGGGYSTGLTYGCNSIRELAPNWIDFALLSQRQRPPRRHGEGSPFRYLELGSGMGLGLCLLAAAYPEGSFIGIDLHPSHIAHSQWLAAELGLGNVSFHEADFLELAEQGAALPFDPDTGFHYSVAHGILSSIGPVVRTALLQLVGRLLRPGGAFYCSYNTYPGWLDRSAFKALADLERQRQGSANLLGVLDKTHQTLVRLFQTSVPLSQSFPKLSNNLKSICFTNQIDYLFGEYGAEYWQAFYVGEMHHLAATHKLSYTASASLPENFPSLLPSPLAEQLASETDPTIRQALQDLAINQSFRRDIFIKGPLRLSRAAQEQQLSEILLRNTHVQPADAGSSSKLTTCHTSLGTISFNSAHVQQVQVLLAERPSSLAMIHQRLEIPPDELVKFTSLLLHAGLVELDRGPAIDASVSSCCVVNHRLMELMQEGHSLGFLAAPNVGHGAQPFSLIDVFVLNGLLQDLADDILCSCVLIGLQASGVDLRGPDGTLLTDTDECLSKIKAHVDQFRSTTFPHLVGLGIIGPVPAL